MLAIIYIIHNIGPIAIYEKWKKGGCNVCKIWIWLKDLIWFLYPIRLYQTKSSFPLRLKSMNRDSDNSKEPGFTHHDCADIVLSIEREIISPSTSSISFRIVIMFLVELG